MATAKEHRGKTVWISMSLLIAGANNNWAKWSEDSPSPPPPKILTPLSARRRDEKLIVEFLSYHVALSWSYHNLECYPCCLGNGNMFSLSMLHQTCQQFWKVMDSKHVCLVEAILHLSSAACHCHNSARMRIEVRKMPCFSVVGSPCSLEYKMLCLYSGTIQILITSWHIYLVISLLSMELGKAGLDISPTFIVKVFFSVMQCSWSSDEVLTCFFLFHRNGQFY